VHHSSLFLSLVVAFAVYLRQVSTNASELRDKIKSGTMWNYPLGTAHTEDKLQALDGICEKIGITAPFMILLTIAAADGLCLTHFSSSSVSIVAC